MTATVVTGTASPVAAVAATRQHERRAMETSESETCACCRRSEEDTGGTELRICRHVAEADEVDEEVVIFTRHVGDDVHKYCGDRDCPVLPVCGGCWDNLYTDGTPWWPETTAAQ